MGHIIKGGGTAISGQEQSLLYKNNGEETTKRTLCLFILYFDIQAKLFHRRPNGFYKLCVNFNFNFLFVFRATWSDW